MTRRTLPGARSTMLATIVALVAGCSPGGSGSADSTSSGPGDAKEFTYEVHYADRASGEANLTYTGADGQSVSTVVELPWESDPIKVMSGVTYRLEADASPRPSSNFYCGVHTSNGWNAGNSMSGGSCSYLFPEDLDESTDDPSGPFEPVGSEVGG